MTLQQLRDFLTVAEHGSFRGAARLLGVSQAGLTNSVKALEASLDTVLFVRTGRGVHLTPAGERLSLRARLIEAESQRAVAEIEQLNRKHAGVVRLGFSPTPSALLLPRVVPDFRSRFPQVELRFMGGLSERLLPAVLQGQLDFAVLSLPDAGLGPDVKSRLLMKASVTVVARRGHPLARARRLAELADQPWILMGPAGAPGGTVIRFFAEAGLPPPRVAVRCDSFTQVAALLSGTDYLALLPRQVLERGLLGALLTEIAIRERAHSYDVSLVHRAEVPLTPVAAELARMFTSFARSLRSAAA